MYSFCFLCPRHMECDYLTEVALAVEGEFPGEVCDRTDTQLAEYREIERRADAAAIADPHMCEDCMRGPAPCEHLSECKVDAARQSRCDEAPAHDPGPSLCGERAVSIDEWVLYHAPEE